jgi:ABC-type transport system involved in multi-copper enzyme maturation permease subunit
MQPIFLIAWNFVRMQWLVITVMSAYLLGITGLFSFHEQRAETALYLQWHSFYVFFLAITLAVSAIQQERKSRRIVAVLSKGIHRGQYLAGLLCGCAMVVGIFWLLIAAGMLVLVRHGGHSMRGLWLVMVALFCCCVAASAVSLFYSVFLHPLMASIATAVTLLLPYVFLPAGWQLPTEAFPVFAAVDLLQNFSANAQAQAVMVCLAAVVWAISFLGAGALVFRRRDVTISPE